VGIAGLVNYQHKLGQQKIHWNNALSIAEAGINYYRWHLAHDPEDFQDGTGEAGPYLHNYLDPYGEFNGQFELDITPPSSCSTIATIKSTGWTNDQPNITRSVQISYGKKSLSDFAFITNSDVFFGEDEVLHGTIHSNGGIRHDGTNDSKVTSAKETYTCTLSQGCLWPETKPGIWGDGQDSDLWEFPVSNIDFEALTMNLNDLKTEAETNGIYLEETGLGWHLNFKNDGTVDIYEVTRLENPISYYDIMGGWYRISWDIRNESFQSNATLPENCAIIFIEDNVWVDGDVDGRITLVAAKLPDIPSERPNIIINDNILYEEKNGDDALGLIAQNDILIPFYSPNTLEIDAVMLSQYGSVYRPFYISIWPWHWPYIFRDTLTTYGSIISNEKWTWTWFKNFVFSGGYDNTYTNYDPNLTFNPPPYFPTVDEYSILRWEDVTEK